MKLSLIAAMDKNRVIGADNQLPWHLPADMRHFRETTLGNAVIMGRKTYESIGKPLPKRDNFVLTRNEAFSAEGITVCHSVNAVIEAAAKSESDEVFVIGGGVIYEIFLSQADKLYLTFVDAEVNGDTYFPEVDWTQWQEDDRREISADSKNRYSYAIVTYSRIA